MQGVFSQARISRLFPALFVVIYSALGIVSVALIRAWKLPFIYSLSNRI